METTETQNVTPILAIAWHRQEILSKASRRRTDAFYRNRRWIIVLGVIATFLALVVQLIIPIEQIPATVKLAVRFLLIATPAISSGLAWYTSRHYSNGAWLIFRAASEEIKKEMFYYRTILQKSPSRERRAYLEKRLAEIQRSIFRNLSGEFAFEEIEEKKPPRNISANDPDFKDLTGEEYFRDRVEDQFKWHNERILQRRMERRRMTIAVAATGIIGTILAAVGESLSLWVALTASITAALVSWQELRNLDAIIKNYSKVVMELTIIYDHWMNLEEKERTEFEFFQMVRACEDVLWAQNTEFIRVMQEALQDNSLEKEASLINQTIKESRESAERVKQGMTDAMVDQTKKVLAAGEEQIVETFKETLGSLAEEASSEIVQKELEAMGKAVTEAVEAAREKASSLAGTIEELVKEFAHIDLSRDTKKEDLNAFLQRLPKTSEVKG